MLNLTLDCGRNVTLDAFDYSRTYAGLLEGQPDAEVNARIIEYSLAEAATMWGPRHTHLIPPEVDFRKPEHPSLPPVLLRAWLICYNSIKSESDGSELVVVWFTADCHTEPIVDVIFRAVRGLAWEQLATDFDW